ncbi:MAG: phosphoglycerate kinase [Dehalococcoidales bacterium]
MNRLTVRDIDVRGKKVFVRVDFNVPLNEKTGAIRDDSRIKASLPTITYLIDNGAKVILGSHLGRPDGKVLKDLRMPVIAERLSQLIGRPVATTPDSIGPEVTRVTEKMKAGDVTLLENLRFHPEEEANNPDFARELAGLAEIYVDDAFGTAHRKHASITGITEHLPAVAGLLMERELTYLGGIMENPALPFGGIFGGLKISDKLVMLENIIPRVDYALIGGCMAATFLKARNYDVGLSLYEDDQVATATRLMEESAKKGACLLLPEDVVVGTGVSPEAKATVVDIGNIPADQMILDIGPRSAGKFCEQLQNCKTVFWNGPLGVNEIPQFAGGTQTLARFLAGLDATVIIGGGSTSEVVTNLGLADKMAFVSTGGGASLKFLGGQKLPGVEALLPQKTPVS